MMQDGKVAEAVTFEKGQKVRYLPTGQIGTVLERYENKKQGKNVRVVMGNDDYLTMPAENWERVEGKG